ncbi:MAG: hypothetical protein U0229_07195 [Anaeromyxobacter sp.]
MPRVYVECLEDRAVTLPLQRRMQADSPCTRVLTLDGSHSPFFSRPEALSAALGDSLQAFGAAGGAR